jgi:hypothetical protein
MWGDLMMLNAPRRRKATPPPSLSPWSIEDEALENYTTPRLEYVEDISREFPVEIVKLPGRANRYALRFDHEALMKMRDEANISWDAAMEYDAFMEYRLLHALRAHPHLFHLEKPTKKDDVVIIELIEKPARAGAGAAVPARAGAGAVAPARAGAGAPYVPALRKLTDIKDAFPGVVVWRKVDGRKGESTYALEVMRTFERANPVHVVEHVLYQLKTALEASRFWYVLPARERGEWVRLEMRHD